MSDIINQKYGAYGHNQAVAFHKSRVMFAIKDDVLYIAEKGIDSSLAEWFEKKGWITPQDTTLMDVIVRGFVDREGIYFYCGYDFHTSETIEKIFLKHLKELVEKLYVDYRVHVYAGLVPQTKAGKFPPQKLLGTVGKLI